MIDRETMTKWITNARRDDWHHLFVGSDIRVMLGEVDRLTAENVKAKALIVSIGILNASGPCVDPEIDRVIREFAAEQ